MDFAVEAGGLYNKLVGAVKVDEMFYGGEGGPAVANTTANGATQPRMVPEWGVEMEFM